MSKVFVSIAASLDGFIAGPNGGMNMHRWMYPLQEFRTQLRIGEGGQTGADNDCWPPSITEPGPASWENECLKKAKQTGPKKPLSTCRSWY